MLGRLRERKSSDSAKRFSLVRLAGLAALLVSGIAISQQPQVASARQVKLHFSASQYANNPGYWEQQHTVCPADASGACPLSASDLNYRENWMSVIPNNMLLSQMTIPGTHDSAASSYGSNSGVCTSGVCVPPGNLPFQLGWLAAQTQSMDLNTQLNVGIRAFDLRLGDIQGSACVSGAGNDIWAVHGDMVCLNTYDLNEELTTFVDWLYLDGNLNFPLHGGEAVILRLKNDTQMSNSDFSSAIDQYLGSKETSCFISPCPYWMGWLPSNDYPPLQYPNGGPPPTSDPTMGDIRGKIVILQDWPDQSQFGLPYHTVAGNLTPTEPCQKGGTQGVAAAITNNWNIEDCYQFDTDQGITTKWGQNGLTAFESAGTGLATDQYFTYLSAATSDATNILNRTAEPWFFAGGKERPSTLSPPLLFGTSCTSVDPNFIKDPTTGDCYYRGLNWTALNAMKANATNKIPFARWGRLGIVYSDFANPSAGGLISQLIATNYQLLQCSGTFPSQSCSVLSLLPPNPSTTTVQTSVTSPTVGQFVTYTATVPSVIGTVTFQFNNSTHGVSFPCGDGTPTPIAVVGTKDVASCTFAFPLDGKWSVSATYSGNTAYTSPPFYSGSTSKAISLVVGPPLNLNNSFSGVSCISASACQAVGDYQNPGSINQTLIESWNGSKFSVSDSPDLPPSTFTPNTLNGVSCTASTFCVAAGTYLLEYGFNSQADQPLIEAWYGTSWSAISLPDTFGVPTDSHLNGVSCTSPSFCVAVGDIVNPFNIYSPLVTLWNGTSWTTTALAYGSGLVPSHLNGVSCTSPTSCEAVGYFVNASNVNQTLVYSWNGTTWSASTSPNNGTGNNTLNGVSCTRASSSVSCKAVGGYVNASAVNQTLVESFNGTTWSASTSPNNGTGNNTLNGVSCTSPTSCEAVGGYVGGGGVSQNLIESLKGTTWSLSTIPNVGAFDNVLSAVSCTSLTTSAFCQVVGRYVNASGSDQNLHETWNSTHITKVSFSGTPASPTITVTGRGFGSEPPGTPAGCSAPGMDFGTSLWLDDTTRNWNAGLAISSGSSCIGLIVSSYTNTQIVFTLGSFYQAGGYQLASGDKYSLTVFGATATGTVSYS